MRNQRNLLHVAGIVVALSSLSGCVCARAPYHGRIPSRNLARAREPAPEAPAPASKPTDQAAPPQYVVAR